MTSFFIENLEFLRMNWKNKSFLKRFAYINDYTMYQISHLNLLTTYHKIICFANFSFSIHKNISFLLHSTPWVAPSNVHTKSHIKDHSGSGFQDNSGVTS